MSETSRELELSYEEVEDAVRALKEVFNNPRDPAFREAMHNLEELSQIDRHEFVKLAERLPQDLHNFLYKEYMD